jgi:hypothetical protein
MGFIPPWQICEYGAQIPNIRRKEREVTPVQLIKQMQKSVHLELEAREDA